MWCYMALTTGPIENVGNQPANANKVRVKILNRTAGPTYWSS